jgi:segregation and condensation protein A
VARILSRYVDDADRTYGRITGPEEHFAALSPDPLEGMTVAKLQAGFVRAITPRTEPSLSLFHMSPIRFTVAEAVGGLMSTLPLTGRTTFRQMVHNLVERLEVIVHFLAILEMYKQGYIEIEWTGRGPDLGDEAMQIDDYEG